ncbi:MAG: hypothetical protein LR008_00915, partial [Candidatus Pacebacteria bacterium]|nr:hypothetical protein [Candidatus Paceibacterota bacterium]
MALEVLQQNTKPSATSEQEPVLSNEESSEVEQRELDLSSIEDLEAFQENAEALYTEILNYEAIAIEDSYKELQFGAVDGVQVFELFRQQLNQLKGEIDHCRYDLIPSESEIEDAQFDVMQELYNGMIDIRNSVLSA